MFNEYFEPYSNNNDTELTKWQKRRFNTYQFIFKQETKESKCFSFFITLVILIAVSSSCLETLKAYRDLIIWDIIEFVCCSIFIIEYIIKIIVVDNKIKYIKTFAHFVDIVSIIPIFFTFQKSSETSNIVSFFKVLKLIRIVKILSSKSLKVYTQLMIETMAKSIYGLKLMIVLIIIAVIFSSSILYQLEKGIREDGTEPYTSIPSTFYWSIVTITTVGYGDVYPITDLGKLFAGFTMILGIILIALPITIISTNFARTWDEFENRGLIKIRNGYLKTLEKSPTGNLKLLISNYCVDICNLNQLTEIERTLVQTLQNQLTDNIDLISQIRSTYAQSESNIIIDRDENIELV